MTRRRTNRQPAARERGVLGSRQGRARALSFQPWADHTLTQWKMGHFRLRSGANGIKRGRPNQERFRSPRRASVPLAQEASPTTHVPGNARTSETLVLRRASVPLAQEAPNHPRSRQRPHGATTRGSETLVLRRASVPLAQEASPTTLVPDDARTSETLMPRRASVPLAQGSTPTTLVLDGARTSETLVLRRASVPLAQEASPTTLVLDGARTSETLVLRRASVPLAQEASPTTLVPDGARTSETLMPRRASVPLAQNRRTTSFPTAPAQARRLCHVERASRLLRKAPNHPRSRQRPHKRDAYATYT